MFAWPMPSAVYTILVPRALTVIHVLDASLSSFILLCSTFSRIMFSLSRLLLILKSFHFSQEIIPGIEIRKWKGIDNKTLSKWRLEWENNCKDWKYSTGPERECSIIEKNSTPKPLDFGRGPPGRHPSSRHKVNMLICVATLVVKHLKGMDLAAQSFC